ncbi:MAG: Ig-like domain-containing protein [Bacteroidaceae bacterium]|nr:Ig-like domain-containing protein [Bacteroidaceae bacterium]MBQ7968173.1 Ig-like domain-containing protein [Bacteroidaceae bacterium]
MKKTLTLLACLVMAMSISARSYVAVADTGYVAPGDTAEVTDPITPPIIDEGEVVDTTSQKEFTLNAEKVKLRVGETFQLSIIWNDPEWAAANSKQIYYYCNSDVASVSEEGLITARRAGETSVSVYANGISHACSVVVDEGEPGVVQHRGRMTLPLGEFLDGEGNEFEVTLTDGIMRLTGSFWGHACIPSELEYEILDGAAFFNIYTSYEDSTCTDGWQGSFMVRQTIDVSFENCTSDVYNVYVSNVHYEVYEEGAMNAIVYRAAPNRYGTDTNVNLNLEGETQALTAEIGEESIHITGYCYSNCGMDLYCVAEEQDGSIALTFYEVGVIGANCMGNHYVDFTIPRLAKQVDEIYAYGPYNPSARFEVKMQGNTSVATILKETITPYYDLTGRKVAHPTRGIYIKDGRKVIIR